MNLTPRVALPALAAATILGIVGALADPIQLPIRWAMVATGILILATASAGLAPYFDHPTHRSPGPPPVKAADGAISTGTSAPRPPSAATTHAQLLAGLPPMGDTPRLVDIDTGELVGDRVTLLEERVATVGRELSELGRVVEDQAQLTAKAFGTLRREVERIGHVFAEPATGGI